MCDAATLLASMIFSESRYALCAIATLRVRIVLSRNCAAPAPERLSTGIVDHGQERHRR